MRVERRLLAVPATDVDEATARAKEFLAQFSTVVFDRVAAYKRGSDRSMMLLDVWVRRVL